MKGNNNNTLERYWYDDEVSDAGDTQFHICITLCQYFQ